MPIKFIRIILLLGFITSLYSCSPKNISSKYYYQHEKVLDKIEETYKALFSIHPFTVGFTDKGFETVSLEIITDTLSYIYEFNIAEARLTDTLLAYHFNAPKVMQLIQQMQSIRCAWIKNLDYYVDEKKNTLVLMSVKAVALHAPLSYKKYYVLTYFQQPQYFDSDGRLLDKRKLRRLRKINGEVFKRINDKVCYTISGKFR